MKKFQMRFMRYVWIMSVTIIVGGMLGFVKSDRVFSDSEVVHIVGFPEVEVLPERQVDTQYVEMGVIVGQMKFDKPEIKVKAGLPVVIVFKNNDVMMHNILVVKPGTLEEVGAAADKMITDPEGQKKGFIPELEAVMHASPLINPGATFRLAFRAPEKKGDYPYVCTFPGHWRLMKGVMKVEG